MRSQELCLAGARVALPARSSRSSDQVCRWERGLSPGPRRPALCRDDSAGSRPHLQGTCHLPGTDGPLMSSLQPQPRLTSIVNLGGRFNGTASRRAPAACLGPPGYTSPGRSSGITPCACGGGVGTGETVGRPWDISEVCPWGSRRRKVTQSFPPRRRPNKSHKHTSWDVCLQPTTVVTIHIKGLYAPAGVPAEGRWNE